jgi:hypothetical protein
MYQIYIKIKQRLIFVVLLLQLVTSPTSGLFAELLYSGRKLVAPMYLTKGKSGPIHNLPRHLYF